MSLLMLGVIGNHLWLPQLIAYLWFGIWIIYGVLHKGILFCFGTIFSNFQDSE